MQALGIDIGGTGIKGAIVEQGQLVGERIRFDSPKPATPTAFAEVVRNICQQLNWRGPIGCGFPSVIHQGVAKTAANIDPAWIDCAVDQLLSERTECEVLVLNDADVAGLAELRFGSQDYSAYRSIMFVTIGTGLGSALFRDGVLFPNTELGHLLHGGIKAEHYASKSVRKRENLDWETWGKRLNEVLNLYRSLFWPDLFVLGGGDAKKFQKFESYLDCQIPVVPATLQNHAGIIGAATAATERFSKP